MFTEDDYKNYNLSDDYTHDLAVSRTLVKPPPSGATANVAGAMDSLTVQEFRRGVKRDKTHYEDLKDDKFFNSWNRGFVATTHMHHTQLVLDEGYVPKNDVEAAVFNEMQIFMYAVLEDHLKTDKG
jgi:hypothetical protein